MERPSRNIFDVRTNADACDFTSALLCDLSAFIEEDFFFQLLVDAFAFVPTRVVGHVCQDVDLASLPDCAAAAVVPSNSDAAQSNVPPDAAAFCGKGRRW